MSEKLYYMLCASTLTLANIFLIETRFNLVGIGFGFAAIYFWIRALMIRQKK